MTRELPAFEGGGNAGGGTADGRLRLQRGFFKRYRMLLPSVPDDILSWSIEDNEEPQTLCVKFLDILLEEGAKPVNYARFFFLEKSR